MAPLGPPEAERWIPSNHYHPAGNEAATLQEEPGLDEQLHLGNKDSPSMLGGPVNGRPLDTGCGMKPLLCNMA